MKKFLLKVALFFGLMVIVDIAFGYGFDFLMSHAKGGSTANNYYIANECTDDVIILGSSRATHHYIPQMIEDSLGVSCYNCGEEGNGVILAYGRYKMLTERYSPKLIIYEITPGYDYGIDESYSKYLGYLRPYYNKGGIEEIFDTYDDELSSIKMLSNMYQNTGKIIPDVLDNIVYRDNLKGYAPLYGTLEDSPRLADNKPMVEIDPHKLSLLETLVIDSKEKGIQFLCAISPKCSYENQGLDYEPALQICKKYEVPVLNNLQLGSISSDNTYFQDVGHMNDKGARLYTQLVINEIKQYIR